MRVTLASSTYIRQATSSGTASAQATAALIGLTWVTTTTTAAGGVVEQSGAGLPDALAEPRQRLAATG